MMGVFGCYILISVCITLSLHSIQCLDLPKFQLRNTAQVSDTITLEYTSFRRRQRDTVNDQPYKIGAKFTSADVEVNLKFRKTKWRLENIPLHYYCAGVKYVHSVTEDRKHCVSIYSDVETKATALVDFCATFRSTPQMIVELPINNTQHIILPVVAPEGQITHTLLRVNEPAYATYRDYSQQDSDNKMTRTSGRHRRADLTTEHTVELMIVVDFTLYKFWYDQTTGANRQQHTLENIRNFYAFIVNGMDMRYRGLSTYGLNLRVKLVHVWIATTPADSPWIETNLETVTSGDQERGTFNGPAALVDFESWVKNKKSSDPNFPKHDHAMLVTARDLTINRAPAAAGYANLGEICTDKSQSVVEDHFNFLSTTLLTHELGHSLGANHDGEANQCTSDDMYIMATVNGALTGTKARNPWIFSACSAASIKDKLTILNSNGGAANCLLTKENPDVIGSTGTLLGQQYDPNKQCKLSHGSSSLICLVRHVGKYEQLCTGIFCAVDGDNTCILTIPADGTTCGNKKWCQNGECVDSNDAPDADETCLFGDQEGVFASGRNCSSFVTSSPTMCYQENVRSPCCTSCANVRRNVTGCEYGDRDDCSGLLARSCYDVTYRTSKCCKKCENLKRSDLPENCAYGDSANGCVAESAFCGVNGAVCCDTCKDYLTTQSTTPPTTPTTVTTTPGTSVPLEDWVIPVAVVGGVVLLIVIIVIIIICCRMSQPEPRHTSSRRHRNRHRNHEYRREKPPSDGRFGHNYGRHGHGGAYEYDNTARHAYGGNTSRY